MADATLKKLISLMAPGGTAEVRRAAVLVAGALQPGKEAGLHQALLSTLDEDDADLRRLAVDALGKLRAEGALPRLVSLVEAGGPEVDAAVQALGQLGARGTKALGKVMAHANPVLRRRIAAALALAGTESAVLATAQALVDEDPGVVEASARSLASEVPLLSAAQKRALAEHLMEMLESLNKASRSPSRGRQPPEKSKETQGSSASGGLRPRLGLGLGLGLAAVSEAAVLRVLAALHAPEAEDAYWARLDADRPAALRSAALQALAALPPPSNEAKLQKLLACAGDRDFQVIAPALMLLKKVPATRKNVKHWLGLLDTPDVAAHVLAVEKLREVDTPEVAKALLRQLRHPDKGLRDSALAALRDLQAGRAALFAALVEADGAEEAWSLARAQGKTAAGWTPAQRQQLFTRACQYHEKEDRRADAFWFVLREIDSEGLRGQLQERALALRKKKDFAGSLAYWRLLTRDPAVGPELRFELAATALKTSSHDPAAAAREADPALHQFSRLLQDPAFDLFGHVRQAKWLEDEDLFYLGFHFAEQHPRLTAEFGKQILELLIERAPRSQLGKNARQKLKSEGLAAR
jgi:HEAT repeat protein